MKKELLFSEELEERAFSKAPVKLHYDNLILKLNANYDFITAEYKKLDEEVRKKNNVPSSAEWLLDNYYIIKEQFKHLIEAFNKKDIKRLPVLRESKYKGQARIFEIASKIIEENECQLDENIIIEYLKEYQKNSILFEREVWALPFMLKLALIEKIKLDCEGIRHTRLQWKRSNILYEDWKLNFGNEPERILKLFHDNLQTNEQADSSFVEHLFYRFRRSRKSCAEVLSTIEQCLLVLGTTTNNIAQKEHDIQTRKTISMGNSITSLHFLTSLDWAITAQFISAVDEILSGDPDGTYLLMDIDSKNYYRKKVEEHARHCGCSEIKIASMAIDAAKAFDNASASDTEDSRAKHVGYYLVGSGIRYPAKKQEMGKHKLKTSAKNGRKARFVFYIGSISIISLIFALIAAGYSFYVSTSLRVFLSVLAGIAVILPASEIAVLFVNKIVSKTIKPAVFARLEFRDGIPEEYSTIVVIPTLLPDEKRVKELLKNLESHYLSNRDENLYFALLGAFKDSDKALMPNDDIILDAALQGVRALNNKYAKNGKNKFFFFHRCRQYNEKNNTWIGWERKRGALIEFNDFVCGKQDTSFFCRSSDASPFEKVKYIITLDSDTILPIGMAKMMIGSMAHPLNRPIIDKKSGIVKSGYGIMQPRIDIESESAGRSIFSRIFTGQEGIDPYSGAISDVYQDLFDEGIFTGKGIYDLKVFQSVLKNSIPEDAILSHDLLEGSYVRTALVSDLKLVDSYPTKFNSYATRLHRWVRGDWQLISFIFSRKKRRNKAANPISLLSRWKLFDNLRRSLYAPSLMLLIALSFIVLPGNIFLWLGFFLLAAMFPLILAGLGKIFSIFRARRTKRHMAVSSGLKSALYQALLNLIFLPYQAWLMISAIFITLARLVTKKNLLEWVTSADAEKSQKNTLISYIILIGPSLLVPAAIAIAAYLLKELSAVYILPLLILWLSLPFVAYLISISLDKFKNRCPVIENIELKKTARKTWRYFEEFADSKNHYLAPDNYQEEPYRGVAHRTSPTNIGMGLLAVLSARDFGYIGISEMTNLLDKAILTMESLKKWNGHLYNWYDTRTLKPLRPGYVSTVDSGNLAGYLITLEQGLKGYLKKPAACGCFLTGFRDTFYCAGDEGVKAYEEIFSKLIMSGKVNPAAKSVDLMSRKFALEIFNNYDYGKIKNKIWKSKILHMLQMHNFEIAKYKPVFTLLEQWPECLQTQDANLLIIKKITNLILNDTFLESIPEALEDAIFLIDGLNEKLEEEALENKDGRLFLTNLKSELLILYNDKVEFLERYRLLIQRIELLSEAIKFLPLYNIKRKLFSIGFNTENSELTNSYYDLFASEARQASYIAIARGEVPRTHWFKLRRPLTIMDGYKGLISWTGTMFEYMMPLLIMKNYKNSLLDETYSFVIKSQKKYGKLCKMPWGVSECSFGVLDKNQDYQYKAIGVPWLGLKRGLAADAVAAPYATFLALTLNPGGANKNIKLLTKQGLTGPYGYYESADYTPGRRLVETKRSVIKSYMAHHQGMILLSLNNYFNDNLMQTRFHSDPAIHAARLLLQEKVPGSLLISSQNKKKIMPSNPVVVKDKNPVRSYGFNNSGLPEVNLMSNGNYSVMITDRGTGYSKSKSDSITRWREDSTLDSYGMFFYLRNIETDRVWSNTYSPLNIKPDKYKVEFHAEKAVFKRLDGNIITETEVILATGDNAEIRRITLKNQDKNPCAIEITSYFETVIAEQSADIAHPAFSNLFIETEFLQGRNCLVAHRRSRSESDKNLWLANAVVCGGEVLSDIQYETDRMQFLTRGRNTRNINMCGGKPLSNTVGAVLDPVMSLRLSIMIEPGQEREVSFITAVSQTDEMLLSIIDKYSNAETADNAFRAAAERNRIEMNYINLEASQIMQYQEMLPHILFNSPVRASYRHLISKNTKFQSSLWQYGISGDLPIMLLVINSTEQLQLLYEVLNAHEYWRLKNLRTNLVILLEEKYSYLLPLHSFVSDAVLSGQTNDYTNYPGDIFILDKSSLGKEEINLLHAVARIILRGDCGTIESQIRSVGGANLSKIKTYPYKPSEYPMPKVANTGAVYNNGLGGFNETGSEYIINLNSGQQTPAPWINVIANHNFGFISSESGSGYTWNQNSRENKLTPWSNDAVSDSSGEAFYIMDDETGELWTPTGLPIRENEPYTISHGYGYSVFNHVSHGIEQNLTQFVPLNESVKISCISLKNISGKKRELSVSYYVRPVMGVSCQQTSLHIKTRLSDSGAILIENHYNESFSKDICFIDTSMEKDSFTCDRKEFFGDGGSLAPEGLFRETLSGAAGIGLDPCAALKGKITLHPDENKDIIFLLGASPDIEAVNTLTQKYLVAKNAAKSLRDVKSFWEEKMNNVKVETPDVSFDLMLNGRLVYQTVACRLWARTAFYQSGGAFGFRDQLQDSLNVAHFWPELTRRQILKAAARQFTEGDVQHWWHEPSGSGIRTRFSDDLLWLPYVTAEYIRISGDMNILKEQISFLEDKPLLDEEDDRYSAPVISAHKATLHEHCILAIDKSLKFGSHGLPLMGSGDWNDGMNTVGSKGRGESVWLGWFIANVLDVFSPLCEKKGESIKADNYLKIKEKIVNAIEDNAWDGNWYKRAFFDDGFPLGSMQNKECKIDSIAQSWAVISGAGDLQRARNAMQSVEDYLVKREDGIITLLTPPFDEGDTEPGYIKGYVPGVRENGGQYTHAAAWVIIAFAKLGDGDKAFELYELINPIDHTRNFREYTRYKVEPYVMAADVYAVHPHTGRGGWSWYTGAAGWMHRAGLEYILGFQKNGDSIIMDPCIPRKWKEYTINYNYNGTKYNIIVKNPDGVSKGVTSIIIDGNKTNDNKFILKNDKKEHIIIVNMDKNETG